MIEKIQKELIKIYGIDIPSFSNLKIRTVSTDKYITWKPHMRLDIISNDYYSSPFYDDLILIANRHLGISEDHWDVDVQIRIPYPIESAKDRLLKDFETQKMVFINET